MKAMGERGDTLIYGGKTIATWKLPKPSRRFNAKRFTESHPELAERFTEEAQASRRLLIKE